MKYPQPTIWQSINVALLGLAASGCGRPLPTPPADSFRTHSSRPTVQLADRVQVHILDSTGRHLERANVSFSLPRVGKDDVLSQAVTDGVGQAILSIPEAARHELLYGSPAELWIVDSQGYVSVGHLSAEMLIAGVGLIEARVAPTTNVVNVRVLAPDGQPVPNARVAVDTLANAPDDPGRRVPNETWLTACTIADRQGRCRVQVPLGQLNGYMRIQAQGLGTQTLPIQDLPPGTDHEFQLASCGKLTVELAGPEGASASLRIVSHVPGGKSGYALFELKSGELQQIEIVSGSEIHASGHASRDGLVVVPASPLSSLAAGESKSLRVELKRGVSVRGRVIQFPSRKPVAFAYFHTYIPPGTGMTVITDADGRFQFNSQIGELKFWDFMSLPGNAVVAMDAPSVLITGDQQELVLPDVQIPDHVWISGNLRSPAGDPIAGEDIVYGLPEYRRFSTTTDEKGQFWLPVDQEVADSFHLLNRQRAELVSKDPLVLRGVSQSKTPSVSIRLISEP